MTRNGNGNGLHFSRKDGEYVLRCSLTLTKPIDEVFRYFADARNLEAITPPWLNFRIFDENPNEMHVGKNIKYRLSLRGMPIWWLTEITAWNPPFSFVDTQLKGPYKKWVHHHSFVEHGSKTEVIDEVFYMPPFGSLTHWLVRPDIARIFRYRSEKLQEIFSCPKEHSYPKPSHQLTSA